MLKNLGDDTFNLKHKVLSFTSRSSAVEKEVIQCFNIETTDTNKISKKLCLNVCFHK